MNVQINDAPSKVLPHTPEAGDPYYAGDCYNASSVCQEWEHVAVSESPYLAYVKTLAHAHPPLRYLADWMQVGTTPLRWKELKTRQKQREERWQRTRITLFERHASGATKKLNLGSAEELRETLSQRNRSETIASRLFMVEDLSQQTVEQLGWRFDIDPLFFREQIVDYSWYNTRDPWANPPSLTSDIMNRSWIRIRNIRLRYHHSKDSFQKARQESNGFNVLRRPDDDENHWHYLDKPGSLVSITRTRTAIWTGRDPQDENILISIVLVDPTVSEGQLLWYGPTNWLPRTSSRESGAPDTAIPSTLFERFVALTSKYPWHGASSSTQSSSRNIAGAQSVPEKCAVQDLFAKPALYAVAAEWLVVCDYLKARLGQIEWELEKPARFRSKGDIIEASLRRLHVWRRLVPVFREMIMETLDQALPTAAHLSLAMSGSETLYEDIRLDYARIQYALNELQSRVDRLTSIVTTEMSIEDSRRALQENHNLARLTWLATTFIPLSFVTGLFSMQTDLSALKNTFGWYFSAALPLTIFVLFIAWTVDKRWWVRAPKLQES